MTNIEYIEARYLLMISVCEKYRDQTIGEGKKKRYVLTQEKREQETEIINKLKSQLEDERRRQKSFEKPQKLTQAAFSSSDA